MTRHDVRSPCTATNSAAADRTTFLRVSEPDGVVILTQTLAWLAARPDKLVNTQLNVDTREAFQHYINARESATDITFNLKDFRHMLALAEGLGCNIALLFDRPGHPLIVEPRPRQQDPQASKPCASRSRCQQLSRSRPKLVQVCCFGT